MAILAGLGAGGVAYYEFSTQIPQLSKQRDDEKEAKNNEIKAHNKTKAELKKTQGELAQTQQDLADTKTQLTKSEARADAQQKRADDLSTKLAKTTSDLQDAQNGLAAYQASGLTADQVVRLDKDFKDAQRQIAAINGEKAVLQRDLATIRAKYYALVGPNTDILLPADLKGTILVVDPKWDFVVLSVGATQGAIQDGEMLVSRDGKLVAKVVIRTVEKDRCIANIVPGWKLGEVIEGDVVTPAHPASS
ncbi:MAG TPA: hypothetical protein VL970_08520 [Candidatus Acidoferrales bacterium]|nr:hypothetical protein [Candidatus Acidoferrales bacterium]